MALLVRDARDEDAEAGAALLREAIRRLCAADHKDDPAAVAAWVANKTAAEFRRWLETPGQSLLVAEREGRLAGVGLIGDDGELRLLYVDPGTTGKGVGTSLLGAMEARARELGVDRVWLNSTATALSFYIAGGYSAVAKDSLGLERFLNS